MKVCVECKHCKIRCSFANKSSLLCRVSARTILIEDCIEGERTYKTKMAFCRGEREGGVCGKAGINFVPRTNLQKIIDKFTRRMKA